MDLSKETKEEPQKKGKPKEKSGGPLEEYFERKFSVKENWKGFCSRKKVRGRTLKPFSKEKLFYCYTSSKESFSK